MKKTFSFLLCAVLLCGIFSSCSSGNASDTETTVVPEDFELKITTDSHYDDVDESAVRAYEKLCNAVINGETEVKINVSLTDDVNLLFGTSFPLYYLVEGIDYLDDDSGFSISYKNETSEHLKLVEEFKTGVYKILEACEYETASKNAFVLNLYKYLSENITVDSSVTSVYDTVTTLKGSNSSISGTFEYLLLQNGISASHVINLNTGSIAKMLSMAEFNGQWYYFDPASEISETSGKGLVYFAMDDERAAINTTEGQFLFTDDEEPQEITDTTYSDLASSTSYTVDGSTVTVKCKGSDDFVFELE